MVAVAYKSTLLGVMKETTEGVALVPSGATKFAAIQGDLEWEKGIQRADNEELTGSIGAAQGIVTGENPTGSFSHYMRGSGTSGTAPNYAPFLEAFFGEQVIAASEKVTDSGSTVSVINMEAAGGLTVARGMAFLIQDPVNGTRCRPIDSIATDAVTLGFDLPPTKAPGAGVSLGRCIVWNPKNEGHPTLALWNYVGNGGLKRLMKGNRVTGFSVEIVAQQLIKAKFDWSGTGTVENACVVTASNKYIDFEDDDGDFTATLTEGFWSPYDIARQAQASMNAANPADATKVVTFQKADGKFKFTAAGSTVFELKFATGTNTANDASSVLGFANADQTGAAGTVGYTSATAQSYAAAYTPTYDTAKPIAAKSMEVLLGTSDEYACFASASVTITGTNGKKDLMSLCEDSGKEGSVVNERTFEVVIKAKLAKHDISMFDRLENNTEIKFFCNYGLKTGGQLTKGYVVYHYSPTANVQNCVVSNEDNVAMVEITLQCHVTAGAGEFYTGGL